MFTCTVLGSPDHPIIRLGGNLTLDHCREIHAELQARLAQVESATLDLGASQTSDLSFVQILYALLKDSTRQIRFRPLPTHLIELVAGLGGDGLLRDMRNRIEDTV